MKKGKNITLLVGIACVSAVVIWQVIKTIFHYFSFLNEDGFKYFIAGDISPIVIMFLLLIIPVSLLARNLKNKTGTLLPIISIIINSKVLLWVLFLSFTPAIPQYLIYSKLGLIDTYFTVIMRFLESGGLLLVIGHVALIVGSFLSLPKKKKQNTINDKDTL
ncbi:MAG: hypothetical protein IJ426_07175 [Clostridia bacterium]|nr:hypothetical protein [Clostridia bacterium]